MPKSQLSKATIARIALLSLAAQYEDQGADPDKGIDLAQADIEFLTARHEDATADLCGAIREIQAHRWHRVGPRDLSIRFEGGVLAGIDLRDGYGHDWYLSAEVREITAQILSACGISKGDVRVTWDQDETGAQVATVRPV